MNQYLYPLLLVHQLLLLPLAEHHDHFESRLKMKSLIFNYYICNHPFQFTLTARNNFSELFFFYILNNLCHNVLVRIRILKEVSEDRSKIHHVPSVASFSGSFSVSISLFFSTFSCNSFVNSVSVKP